MAAVINEHDDIEQFLSRNKNVVQENEFFVSTSFSPDFICRLIYHGFLPMCEHWGGQFILLPKFHLERCVMQLGDAHASKELHIGRKARKAAKNFTLTVDQAFDGVVQGCRIQHGDNCWLHPPLMAALKTLVPSPTNDFGARNPHRVTAHSFEVWDKEGNMVAGEVGYCVGGSYTSMSGFHFADSAGTVQCCATARLLERLGYELWDLGMAIEYKLGLGAKNVPRASFLQMLGAVKNKQGLALHVAEQTLASDVIVYTQQPR